jgi:hypothetical protein
MTRISFLALIVSFTSVCAQAETVVQRTADDKCAIFDENGKYVEPASDNKCGADQVIWDDHGRCVLTNFAGKTIRTISDVMCGLDKYQRVLVRDGKPLSVLNDLQYYLLLSKGSFLGTALSYAEHKALSALAAVAFGLIPNPQSQFRDGDEVLCYRTSGGGRIKNTVHTSYCTERTNRKS